jgi:hypothetical protein
LRRLVILLLVVAVFLSAACGGESVPSEGTPTASDVSSATSPGTTATTSTTTTTTTTPTTVPATTTTVVAQSPGVWARVPHDETVFGGDSWQRMLSVAAGGPGLVAVGYDDMGGNDLDAVVWTSPDGVTWSRVPHDETVFGGDRKQIMFSVTAGGPGLVAVGYDSWHAAVWTSPDGFTWARVPHDETVFGGDSIQTMESVVAGGPGLVAVGGEMFSGSWQDAAVWTSPDGLTWTQVPHDETVFGGDSNQGMLSVTAGGPGLVAVGYAGPDSAPYAVVWTSPDGLTWTRVPHDGPVCGDYHLQLYSVVAAGPGLVAVGSDSYGIWPSTAAVLTSPDGLTWTRVPHNETVFGDDDSSQAMRSVAAGGPGVVAVGYGDRGAAVWISPDGLTWTQVPHDEAVFGGHLHMHSVVAGGPGLVAVGGASVWYWTPDE